MGMYLSVYGYKEPDEEWLAKKAVYDACVKNNKEFPEKIANFFDADTFSDDPEDIGHGDITLLFSQEVDIQDAVQDGPVDEIENPHVVIDLEKLPAGTKKLLVRYW